MYRHAHWWFLLVVVVVAGGFAPTFFTRLGETALAHMIHGVSSSLWLLLLVTQSLLVTRGGRAWHRRLGCLAFRVPGIPDLVQALNPMMVLTSPAACVLIWDDRRRGKVYPPYPLTLALMLLVHAFMWRAPESAWWRGLVDGLVGAP